MYKAKIYIETTKDTAKYNFSFDYINKRYVQVSLDNKELTYGSDYTVEGHTVTLTDPPTGAQQLIITRKTPTDKQVEWYDSSILRAKDLNLFNVQILHINEEAQDIILDGGIQVDLNDNRWEGKNTELKNLKDPTLPQSAVTRNYLENTEKSFTQRMNDIVSIAKTNKEATDRNLAKTTELSNSASTQAYSAKSSADFAETKANEAKVSAEKAEASEDKAKVSETNSKASEVQADKILEEIKGLKAQVDTKASEVSYNNTTTATNTLEATKQAQLAKEYAESAKEVVGGDYATNSALAEVRSEVSDFKKTAVDNLSTLNADLTNLSTTATVNHKVITQEISKINTEVSSVKSQVATEVQSGLNEVKTLVNTKADSSNTYTKTEVDSKVNAKADSSNTYTKSEVDSKVNSNAIPSKLQTNINEKINVNSSSFVFKNVRASQGWPQNGSVIETNITTDGAWVGSLLISDDGNGRLWHGGWSNGQRIPYRQLAELPEVVTDVRLGAEYYTAQIDEHNQAGTVVTEFVNYSSRNTTKKYIRYKPIQIYKNEQWYTIGG